MAKEARHRYRPSGIPPITRRILAVNVLALGILVAGVLYLGQYRRSLISTELAALGIQAEMFAAALGEGAVITVGSVGRTPTQEIMPDTARQVVRRLAETTNTRARLFSTDGTLLADSRILLGPGGMVQIEELPPPGMAGGALGAMLEYYDSFVAKLPGSQKRQAYRENVVQRAGDYGEVLLALAGDKGSAVRTAELTDLILSAAVPVQRYKQVLGALMLSKGSLYIDTALFEVRQDIMTMFALAFGVTILLSVYLAGTIARPIQRLAAAADQVRQGHLREHALPVFADRNDEIGALAGAMHDMTEALWQRIDANERFAADVAHEIKNPLTSLNSAVETAARIKDPEQQRKLMTIIQEDVRRLDRLITDISDASRLDGELLRAEYERVEVGTLLETLLDMYEVAESRHKGRLTLESAPGLSVDCMEGRLVQVFRNLIGNALSFTPPDRLIDIRARRDGDWTVIEFEDHGPGISLGKEEDIFDRFYSERPKGEKFGTHSGLGLSISRQIIEAHQGTLTAENRLGNGGKILGARFIVRLPLVPQGSR